MLAICEYSKEKSMIQKIFTGTEQEYERYKRKRKYTPKRITVYEEVSEEDFEINKEERKDLVKLILEMQEEAKKNGLTEESLNKILNEKE